MTREEAGELLETLRVLWPNSKLPNAGDYRAVEAYKTETAAMFDMFSLDEVRETVREMARASEWLPSLASILRALEAKAGTEGQKGAKAYQYDEWFTDAEGYEYVKTYTIVKAPDGGLEIPRALRGRASRAELLKRRILTTDDLVEMAKAGELTAEEFITEKDENGRPLTEWRLDHYTVEPARVLEALSGFTRPANAILSEENAKVVQDTVYDLFERINADFDDIPF